MYDTIRIYCHNRYPDFNGYNFYDILEEKFGERTDLKDEHDNLKIYKRVDGLNYKISSNYLSIEGSLCKFYHGDNFRTLEFGEVKKAIEKIEDFLEIPLTHGIIERLDFATNLNLDRPVVQYMDSLSNR
jgi:hypothetical protein